MANEKLAEIFARCAVFIELKKKALDRAGHIRGGATVAYRTSDGGKLPHASADAKVIGVNHFAVNLDFFAFNADVRDPVLAATVGTAGHVDAELFLEAGH